MVLPLVVAALLLVVVALLLLRCTNPSSNPRLARIRGSDRQRTPENKLRNLLKNYHIVNTIKKILNLNQTHTINPLCFSFSTKIPNNRPTNEKTICSNLYRNKNFQKVLRKDHHQIKDQPFSLLSCDVLFLKTAASTAPFRYSTVL